MEKLAIQWLRETGWEYYRGYDIAPDGPMPQRQDYYQVVQTEPQLETPQ